MSSLSIEEKQKSLYAAIIRYSSDTQSLRERAVDHLVLISLQDSDVKNYFRVADIRKAIGRGVGAEGIRAEVIQDSLSRLMAREFVRQIEVKHKPAYFVDQKGVVELQALSGASNDLIIPCINRMISGVEFDCPADEVMLICKRFIINCFVEYGQSMAKCVTGEMGCNEIHSFVDARRTFSRSVQDIKICDDEKEVLYSACSAFLRSSDKRDAEVKFLLTQVYYLAKVLELDPSDFDPLAEGSFTGAVIYLDSNVIFESLFDVDNKNLFDNLVDVSKRLDIELCITQATIGNPPKKPLGSKVENSRNMTRGGSTCANPSLPTARSWQS
jgi:hypothetical protein